LSILGRVGKNQKGKKKSKAILDAYFSFQRGLLANSMAKAIDETISRHNLMPPQVESVFSFAKGSYK